MTVLKPSFQLDVRLGRIFACLYQMLTNNLLPIFLNRNDDRYLTFSQAFSKTSPTKKKRPRLVSFP